MKTCASGKNCQQVPWMKEHASFAHNCSRCRKPVHVWCLGENEEGGSKTCACCYGGGPGALNLPPLPPPNWESEAGLLLVHTTHGTAGTSDNNSKDAHHATLKQREVTTGVKEKNHGIKRERVF
jgi:hypothetical protein